MFFSPNTRDLLGGATVASGESTVVLGPVNLSGYPRKAFTLYNQSAVTLSGGVIQTNPDVRGYDVDAAPRSGPDIAAADVRPAPNPGLWETYDATSFQSLASAGVKTVFVNGNVARWWRVLATSSLPPDVTISGWLNATAV